MKFRDIFDKEGLSLAGMVLIGVVVLLLFGVMLGNWLLRLIAGPPAADLEVARVPAEIVPIQQDNLSDFVIPAGDEIDIPVETIDESGIFVVQVGAFNSRDNANKLKSQLEDSGFTVWVTDTQPYRVHLGAFDNRQEAETMRDEVEKRGYEAFIAH